MIDMYTINEIDVDGTPRYAIRLNGEFSEFLWYLGGVELEEPETGDGPLTVKYEYHTIEGGELSPADQARFEQIIGNVVVDMIRMGIEEENLVFHGGT